MEQEVYVDLYFLINTCMNLLALMISATLLHRKISRWRAWLAAAAGGLWAVMALFLGVEGFWGLLCDATVIFLMCTAVFATKKTSFGALLKCTLVGVLTSMILGGVMTALYSLFNRFDLPLGDTQESGSSILIFVLIAALAGGGAYYFLKVKGKNKPQTKGSSDLDDYDYGMDEDDDDYADFEPYEEKEEAESK